MGAFPGGAQSPEESPSISRAVGPQWPLAHTTATICQSRGYDWCQVLYPGAYHRAGRKEGICESLPITWMGTGSLFLVLSLRSQRPLGSQDTALDPSVVIGLRAYESPLGQEPHLPSLPPPRSYHDVHALLFVFVHFSCCQNFPCFIRRETLLSFPFPAPSTHFLFR